MLKLDYFNPVVDDWNEEAYQRELTERRDCDYCLYTITPRMTGVYSIAEVVDDSNKRPEKTILCVLPYGESTDEGDLKFFTIAQMKSLGKVGEMVEKNGGKVFGTLEQVASYLNSQI